MITASNLLINFLFGFAETSLAAAAIWTGTQGICALFNDRVSLPINALLFALMIAAVLSVVGLHLILRWAA